MHAPRWSNLTGSNLAVVAPRKDAEDCTPGEVESAGQTIYRLALEPQPHNILVAASDQDASQPTRLIVAATGQWAGEAMGVDIAAVIAVLRVLWQGVRASPG